MTAGHLDADTVAEVLRRDDRTPLHVQLENGLRHLIRTGQVPVGADLPGELDLAAALGLSRHTIRHALSTLVAEGLLRRERGRGTRVVAPGVPLHVRRLDRFYAFAWEVTAQGMQQRSEVLESATVEPTPRLAEHLRLGTGALVKRIVRVRMADGEPLIVETTHLPIEFADALDADVLERGSIYDEIERRYRVRVTRAQETIRPVALSRALAALLGVRKGALAFHVERTTWAGDRPIEWQESIVRGDRFLYSVELERQAQDGDRPSAP